MPHQVDTSHPGHKRDIRFVIFTIVLMLGLNLPAGWLDLGWKSAAFNTGFMSLLFALYIIKFRDSYLLGWAIFGVAAGFTELIADWWLVNRTQSLVYAQDEPMLVASPIYMPFAWALLLLQIGAIGHWLARCMPMLRAALLTGLVAGVNIPLYESLARTADWWIYQSTPMVWGAPYYIILGEFLLALPLVWMAVWIEKLGPVKGGVLFGIVEGLVILIAYVIAWWLLGPCEGAVIQLSCS